MIPVHKGKVPRLLEWYHGQEGACWGKNAPAAYLKGKKVTFFDVHNQTAQALARDQHGLCAYCMRAFKVDKAGNYAAVRVEHYRAQSAPGVDPLDYANMLACCMGHLCAGVDCCDQKKDGIPISLNPLDRQHPVSRCIRYAMDGAVIACEHGRDVSPKHPWNKDINDTLNLNHPILKSIRRAVRQGVVNGIRREFKAPRKPTKMWVHKRIKAEEANQNWPSMWGCTKYFLEQSCKQHK